MKIFVSGSIAYDCIMDFHDQFKNHIMPDKLHILNVSFFVPTFKKEKGGTGHNIAYTLGLLGEKAILFGAVGKDFDESNPLIDYSYLHYSQDKVTAFCYIMTDQTNNQITAFHPGAMIEAHQKSLLDLQDPISYAMISPNDQLAMIQHLKQAYSRGVKTFFDPGQQIINVSVDQLKESIEYSNYLIVNDYEFDLFLDKTGFSQSQLVEKFEKIIVTLGEKGVKLIDKNGETLIPAIKVENVVDPTGAGDALRGGLLKGLNMGYDWTTSVKIGMLCAWYCIQFLGPQNHSFGKEEFVDKFGKVWGEKIDL